LCLGPQFEGHLSVRNKNWSSCESVYFLRWRKSWREHIFGGEAYTNRANNDHSTLSQPQPQAGKPKRPTTPLALKSVQASAPITPSSFGLRLLELDVESSGAPRLPISRAEPGKSSSAITIRPEITTETHLISQARPALNVLPTGAAPTNFVTTLMRRC